MSRNSTTKWQLVLASSSPRRVELLNYLKIPFRVICSSANEDDLQLPPGIFAQMMSLKKAYNVYPSIEIGQRHKTIILGADTVVSIGCRFFRRPKDLRQAQETLEYLAGKKHLVTTGVSLLLPGLSANNALIGRTFAVETWVNFGSISKELLTSYLSHDEWKDKAGAYGIQGMAQLFIERVDGSYSNVVGLPLQRLVEELDKYFGATDWQNHFRCD